MEMGIRLSFVKTSELRGKGGGCLNTPNPPPRYATDFNQQCLIRKVIPNYAKFKIPYTSPASQVTQKKIHIIRTKDEIKFLYKKKQKLNRDLYDVHLKAAQEWGNMWHTIMDSIHFSVN